MIRVATPRSRQGRVASTAQANIRNVFPITWCLRQPLARERYRATGGHAPSSSGVRVGLGGGCNELKLHPLPKRTPDPPPICINGTNEIARKSVSRRPHALTHRQRIASSRPGKLQSSCVAHQLLQRLVPRVRRHGAQTRTNTTEVAPRCTLRRELNSAPWTTVKFPAAGSCQRG